MQAVLLTGALTDGLGPLTQMRHVPTLPVANVPLIFYLMGMLRHNSVSAFTININHGADNVNRLIRDLKADEAEASLNISYSMERQLVGSANVLGRLTPRPQDPFVVVMGDIFFENLDLSQLLQTHQTSGAAVSVLACRQTAGFRAYGLLDTDQQGRLLNIQKEPAGKPAERERDNQKVAVGQAVLGANPVTNRADNDQGVYRGVAASDFQRDSDLKLYNTGLYILNPSVIDLIPEDQTYQIGRDLLPALIKGGHNVQVIETSQYYLRVNSFEQYWQLNLDLASKKLVPPYQPLQPVTAAAKTKIDPSARLEGAVIVGQGCRIDSEVVIKGPVVLGDNVIVKSGSIINQCIVMPNTTLGLATRFEKSILYGSHVVNIENNQIITIADRSVLQARKVDQLKQALEQVFHSVLALLILLLLSPLFLVVAIAVVLDSRGPLWYSQLRVGQRKVGDENPFFPGKVFRFYKFRSMRVNAASHLEALMENNTYKTTTFVKLKHDPRITRVGRIIRKTSIDELPQLINVIKGDMRLVGNRPLPLYEAQNLTESWQQVRFSAPAGLTGLWQVSGRSNLSREERIILDNYYAVTRTFWNDMKILVLTVPAVLLQRGSH